MLPEDRCRASISLNFPLNRQQHGRMAMLGILGLIVPEFVRVPGEIFQNVSVLDAHNAMVSLSFASALYYVKLTKSFSQHVCVFYWCVLFVSTTSILEIEARRPRMQTPRLQVPCLHMNNLSTVSKSGELKVGAPLVPVHQGVRCVFIVIFSRIYVPKRVPNGTVVNT